uniref:RPN13_C domain-containing protein n=1 Tax=Heterorhabditis bacteriophora TaxID=37862 RepID=A0A1I7WY64_HETBA
MPNTSVKDFNLEKKSTKEILEELERIEGEDEPFPVVQACPSEYQLSSLNNMLSFLPVVQAFNAAEKKNKP